MMRIGFIGSGKMAEALLSGMLDHGVCTADSVVMSDWDPARCDIMQGCYGVKTSQSNLEVVRLSDVVILAVKPQDLETALVGIADESDGKLFVSIAAGKRVAYFETKLTGARVVRVMPNLACQVGQGMSVYCGGSGATSEDVVWVRRMLESCGRVMQQDESQFDVVTALSGSSPAFFAYVLKALTDAAVAQGMERAAALELALQTMLGAAVVLQRGHIAPDPFMAAVASKGGTTAAGLAVLENSDLRLVLKQTLDAAAARSAELGS